MSEKLILIGPSWIVGYVDLPFGEVVVKDCCLDIFVKLLNVDGDSCA